MGRKCTLYNTYILCVLNVHKNTCMCFICGDLSVYIICYHIKTPLTYNINRDNECC